MRLLLALDEVPIRGQDRTVERGALNVGQEKGDHLGSQETTTDSLDVYGWASDDAAEKGALVQVVKGKPVELSNRAVGVEE